MSFEAEVIPLFIGGVIAVSAIEFSGYCLHFQLCEYRPFRPLLGCQRPLRGSDALPLGCTKTLIIPVCGSGYPVNTCVSCHNARPVRSSCAVFGGSAALQTRRTACG